MWTFFLLVLGLTEIPPWRKIFPHFLCFKRTASLYFAARWGRGVRSPLSSTVAPAPHIGPCPLAWNFAALAIYQELSFRTYLRSLQCCASPWTSLLSDFEFQLDLLIRSLDWISMVPMAVFVWDLSLGFVTYSYVCENVSHSLIHYKDLFSFFWHKKATLQTFDLSDIFDSSDEETWLDLTNNLTISILFELVGCFDNCWHISTILHFL